MQGRRVSFSDIRAEISLCEYAGESTTPIPTRVAFSMILRSSPSNFSRSVTNSTDRPLTTRSFTSSSTSSASRVLEARPGFPVRLRCP